MEKKYRESEFYMVREAEGIDKPFILELCPFCREPASKSYNYCCYCSKKIKGKKLIKETIK